MKYVIILGDGMADEPVELLGNLTPLQYASTPAMDLLARKGNTGLLHTIPEGMHPGSEVANLSVLGYDPARVLEGRGALEAASMGIDILPGEMVMRCNLICIEDGKIKNHSAGHISTGEAEILIRFLNEELPLGLPPSPPPGPPPNPLKGEWVQQHAQSAAATPPSGGWGVGRGVGRGVDWGAEFFPGISYRHILKLKGGNKHLDCTPPHDVPGTEFRKVLIKAEIPEAQETAGYLNDLIIRSQTLLENHPVNLKRKAEGKDPANSIWPWSPGYKPQMKPLSETCPIRTGAVISAVDLIKGIGIYAGLKNIDVPGATGLYDTNYEGKAQAALKASQETDFVYVHVEASDEAGHEGDVQLKVKTIENLDKRLLKPILEAIETGDEPVTIALLPDHPTPCRLKTHTNSPVPFVIYKPGEMPDGVTQYDEFSVEKGKYGLLRGDEFIRAFFEDEK